MYKKEYGDPLIALRVPSAMIAGARIAARQHGQSLSAFVRELIGEQLEREGIAWQKIQPMEGQMRIEENE